MFDVLRRLSLSVQVYIRFTPQVGLGQLPSISLRFVIYKSSYHSTLCVLRCWRHWKAKNI